MYNVLKNERFKYTMLFLIVLNLVFIVIETIPDTHFHIAGHWIKIVSLSIFSIEYVLRIYFAEDRKKYIFSFLGIVDLLVIIPLFIPLSFDSRILKIFIFFRILKIFKINRYTRSFYIIKDSIMRRKDELLLSLIAMMTFVILFSSAIFFLEHDAQPDKFVSIPHTMWWTVVTMSTTGYGDLFPITAAGKIVTSIMIILGVMLFALPVSILTAGFLDTYKEMNKKIE